MQLFRRFFRFYNEINVYGTTSGRSNDDYKCFIDYYKAIDFPSFCRIQKKYAPKTLGLNCSHTWEQKAALMLAIIITNACKKEGMLRLRTKSLKLFSTEKKLPGWH